MLRAAAHFHWIDRAYGMLLALVHAALLPLFIRLDTDDPLLMFVVLPAGMTIAGTLLLLRIPLAWIIFFAFATVSILVAPLVAIVGLVVLAIVDWYEGLFMVALAIGLSAIYAIGFALGALCARRKKEFDQLQEHSPVVQQKS